MGKERIASGGVRVDEQPIAFDVDLEHEDVEVERVFINRMVDVPAQTRMDGDVLVVPIHEEIIVKHLFLVEELRINPCTRTKTPCAKNRCTSPRSIPNNVDV